MAIFQPVTGGLLVGSAGLIQRVYRPKTAFVLQLVDCLLQNGTSLRQPEPLSVERCQEFRKELEALQVDLRKYTKALADIADVEDLTGLAFD